MAVDELKSVVSPDTDENQASGVINHGPNGDSEPEEGEIVGDVDSSEGKGEVANQRHPLEHSWTFWFDNPSAKARQVAWGASMRPIYSFSTVEDFWGLYNNIHHPSKLSVGADLYCFKHNIEPKWEDPVCANGGKWTVNFSRGKSDVCWLYTLLAMIGEQFDHGDEICGVVVNVRARQDKVSLWTKNASNESAMVILRNPIYSLSGMLSAVAPHCIHRCLLMLNS
ncbi:hypothetical protein SAY86_011754 [Trapa natans]|uniref:Eukaryotic translation initiation factor 4E-1 n=1 Tax=Trapa natans TaxID=22666 RepID=A0AAN7R5E1_TRANT|nr:hypothetical protein SAY86_011754 [Trapa natans]